MKTIGERAREYAPDAFDPDEIIPAREGYMVERERRAFMVGAMQQKEIDKAIFEKWYCKNICYRRKECQIPLNICFRIGEIEKQMEEEI